MLGMMRWRSVAKVLLVVALVGVLGLNGWVDRGGASQAIAAPRPASKVSSKVFETAPPQLIEDLQAEFEDNQPQVKVLEPKPDEVLQDNIVAVRFQVTDLPIFKSERLGLGPHLHVLLDNQTYQPVYDITRPLILENLSPGTHTLRVFASRPWHESFKNEGAYAQVTFHVYTKTDENQPNPDQPLLTYSRPQGSYGAEPVMLDFYLTNAPLHLAAQEDPQDDIADWRIRITVNGTEFILDQWEPLYLKGFKPGKNWVKLEYIDEQGNPVNNLYSNTARLITLEPGGQDGLARIVRGDVSLEEARTITSPTYTYTPPVPPEPVLSEPVLTPEPELIKPEPIKPEPAKPEPAKPEPVKPEPAKPEPVKPEPTKPETVKPIPIALPSPAPADAPVVTPSLTNPRQVSPLQDKPEPKKALKTPQKPAIAEPPSTATPVPSPAAIAPKPTQSKSPSLLRPRSGSKLPPVEESRKAPAETSIKLTPVPKASAPPQQAQPELEQTKVSKPVLIKPKQDQVQDENQDDKPASKKFEFGKFNRTLPEGDQSDAPEKTPGKSEQPSPLPSPAPAIPPAFPSSARRPQADLAQPRSSKSANRLTGTSPVGGQPRPTPSPGAAPTASKSASSENEELAVPATAKTLVSGEPQPSSPRLGGLLNRFRQKALDLQKTALDFKDKASTEVKKEVSGLKVPTLQDLQRNRRPDLPPSSRIEEGTPSEESKIPLNL